MLGLTAGTRPSRAAGGRRRSRARCPVVDAGLRDVEVQERQALLDQLHHRPGRAEPHVLVQNGVVALGAEALQQLVLRMERADGDRARQTGLEGLREDPVPAVLRRVDPGRVAADHGMPDRRHQRDLLTADEGPDGTVDLHRTARHGHGVMADEVHALEVQLHRAGFRRRNLRRALVCAHDAGRNQQREQGQNDQPPSHEYGSKSVRGADASKGTRQEPDHEQRADRQRRDRPGAPVLLVDA